MALGSASGQTVSASESGSAHTGRALAIVTTLFFMWGFLTTLNDTLIPHLKQIFTLNYTEAMLVQFSFFGSYFIFAQPAGKLIEMIGYKRTMVVGLGVMALGVFLFLPAAGAQSYPFFLAAEIVLAAGVTALQVAANPYVTVLGPAQTASTRLNLTQAFNSLGTVIAPIFGSAFILASAAEMARMTKQEQATSLKLPYAGIGIMLLLLAIAIALVKLPRIQATREFRTSGDPDNPMGSIWTHRHVWLGAIGIFAYVGAEVAIGSSLVNYMEHADIGAFSAQRANAYLIFYWGGLMVGRFFGSAILKRVSTGPLVGFLRHRRRMPGHHLHAHLRAPGHVVDAHGGPFQLHHVPQHLHSGYSANGPTHRQGLRSAGAGYRRWGDHPLGPGSDHGPHRHPPWLHSARILLSLHHFLRLHWLTSYGRKGRTRGHRSVDR